METNTNITEEILIDNYMDYVLNHTSQPQNVHTFAKENGIKEAEFYSFFSSFDVLESHIFKLFFDNTMNLLLEDESYREGNAKHKLLSFYFTFFEILTANRTFVLYCLNKQENKLKTLSKLKGLRKEFTNFITTLEIERLDLKMEKANHFIEKSQAEAAFGQLLLILKFWMHDTSAAFEKTDILIEKSMLAGFEIINIKPIESLIDLGKFLWKEKGFKS